MGIDERSRHRMYLKLEELLGSEDAGTLMEHLPPTGWADVARRSDLDHLEAALRRDFQAELHKAINALTFRLMTFMSALTIALAGLAFGAAHLA